LCVCRCAGDRESGCRMRARCGRRSSQRVPSKHLTLSCRAVPVIGYSVGVRCLASILDRSFSVKGLQMLAVKP
jgi:hypothetical protein